MFNGKNLSYLPQAASYSRVPPSISGMRLVDVCKTMTGSAFQYQRLRLNFVPSHFGFSHCDSLQTIVVDDIVGMKVRSSFKLGTVVVGSNTAVCDSTDCDLM